MSLKPRGEGGGEGIGKDRSARRFFQLGGSEGSCRLDGVVGSAKESRRRRTAVAGGEEGGGRTSGVEGRAREEGSAAGTGGCAGENCWRRVAEGGLSSGGGGPS